jgi:hypothetical protein
MSKRQPLISDADVDVLVIVAFAVIGTPISLALDGWRWARTGEVPAWLRAWGRTRCRR